MSQPHPEHPSASEPPAPPQYGVYPAPQPPAVPQYGVYPAAQPPAIPQYGVYPPVQQSGYPQQYGVGYPQQVAPKSPGLSLLASFFIPGLGTLINGNAGLGIAIFVAYRFAWLTTMILIGFLLLPAVWIWGMIDAYQGAQKWNTAHGILS
jgi:TM2 domain-containing membrane protein YozV